jgi:hypothetical protein
MEAYEPGKSFMSGRKGRDPVAALLQSHDDPELADDLNRLRGMLTGEKDADWVSAQSVGEIRKQIRALCSRICEGLSIDVVTGDGFTPELLDEMARFRREVFNNGYGDWARFLSDGRTVLFAAPGHYAPIEEMDAAAAAGNLPVNDAGEQAVVYRQPKKIRQLVERQFTGEDGVAVIVRKKGNRIAAMAAAYITTMSKAWELEWSHPYLYMDSPPGAGRDFGEFMDQANAEAEANGRPPLTESEQVVCLSCLAVEPSPSAKAVRDLARHGIRAFRERAGADITAVAETRLGSPVHRMMRASGALEIEDYLDGDDVITIVRLEGLLAKVAR